LKLGLLSCRLTISMETPHAAVSLLSCGLASRAYIYCVESLEASLAKNFPFKKNISQVIRTDGSLMPIEIDPTVPHVRS